MRNKSYLFIFLFLFIGCIEEKVCNTEYVSNGDEFGIIFEGFNDNETKNLKLVYDKNKKIDYEKDTLTIYTSFNKYISLKSFCITIKDTIKLTDTINIFFQSKKNMLYGFKNVEEEIHYQGPKKMDICRISKAIINGEKIYDCGNNFIIINKKNLK